MAVLQPGLFRLRIQSIPRVGILIPLSRYWTREWILSHGIFEQPFSTPMFQVCCRFLTADCQVLNQDRMESESAGNLYLTVMTARRCHLVGQNWPQCVSFDLKKEWKCKRVGLFLVLIGCLYSFIQSVLLEAFFVVFPEFISSKR